MTKIDEIDLKILNELIVDAKKAYTQIAKDLTSQFPQLKYIAGT